MKIEFSQHAVNQLKIRTRITKQMVVETVKNPDETSLSYKNRKLYRKRFSEEILEIVTTLEDNKTIIITEYLLEK